MNIEITKQFISDLKTNKAYGQSYISLAELKKINSFLENKSATAIYLRPSYYVMFDDLPGVELVVEDCKDVEDLSFISNVNHINASKGDISYIKFLTNELFQGKGITRLKRFLVTLSPLLLLNLIIFHYATLSTIGDMFTGLLAAISIFVAIFSLFTISQDYLKRKQSKLFRSGKLSYYFSIDRHMVTTGLIGIFTSILGVLVTPPLNGEAIGHISDSVQYLMIVAFANLSFFAVLIVLRSLKEFYINRPGAYIMGDLKREVFKEESKD